MKSNEERKLFILLTLGFLFTLSAISLINFDFTGRTSNYSNPINFNYEKLKFSKISGKIHINGNSGWANAQSTGICTGNGTYSDPYVIEDLEIDGGGSGHCIWIENSDVYFKIENCTLYNSGSFNGINLQNSDNGIIFDNNANNNFYGIVSQNSNHNIISANTANDNWNEGIKLINSNYNIVSGNIANDNDDGGIGLSESDYNIVSGNTVRYNGYGIALASDSNNNNISGNTASDNGGYGIYIPNFSDDNDISGNTASNNGEYGIYLNSSDDNSIYFNNFINNNRNLFSSDSLNTWNSPGKFIYNYKGEKYTNYLGNYWDNYTGIDENNDGIGDTPFVIINGIIDNYPLMEPIENYELLELSGVSGGEIPGYNLFVLLGILSVVAIILIKKIQKS